jgi:hypothetical protein
MKTFPLSVIVASITLLSCKTPSEALKSEQAVTTKSATAVTTKSATAVTSKETVYDIIVSFISKASGIDDVLKTKVDTALSMFNKKYDTNIQPEIVHWGREGEKDYLFITKKLSVKQKKELITRFKTAIGSSDMAHLFLSQKSARKK